MPPARGPGGRGKVTVDRDYHDHESPAGTLRRSEAVAPGPAGPGVGAGVPGRAAGGPYRPRP